MKSSKQEFPNINKYIWLVVGVHFMLIFSFVTAHIYNICVFVWEPKLFCKEDEKEIEKQKGKRKINWENTKFNSVKLIDFVTYILVYMYIYDAASKKNLFIFPWFCKWHGTINKYKEFWSNKYFIAFEL